MTAKEIQKRSQKAEQLRVLQSDDEQYYYVESSKGKIMYQVQFDDKNLSCTCGDFARGSKKDDTFNCKHIMSVIRCLGNGGPERGSFLKRSTPKLDERFIMNIKGKDFVLYSGLLDLSHQRGLQRLEVEIIQFPTKENGLEAICMATAETKTADLFIDIGDANPKNTNKMIAQHIIRMASTRAKARVLRDLSNIGMTALEELGDLDDVVGNDRKPQPTAKPKSKIKKMGTPEERVSPTTDTSNPDIKSEAGTANESTPEISVPEQDSKPVKKRTTKAKTKPGNGKGSADNPDDDKVVEMRPKLSEAQLRAVYNLARRRSITEPELQQLAMEAHGVEVEHLESKDAATFIRNLQQSA